ncbi:MAG: transglutaminase family protein [Candidatus Bruticola sp.]
MTYNLSETPQLPAIEDCESIKRSITLTVSYKNLHTYPCRASLKIPLLQNRPSRQEVIDFSLTPKPDRQSRDEFGNSYAHYDKLTVQPGENFTVNQQAILKNEAIVYNFSRTDWAKAAKKTVECHPLKTDYWQEVLAASSPAEEELQKLATKAIGSQQSVLYKLISVYDFMRTGFSYGSDKAKTSFSSMLKERRLQCADAALLTAKLLQLNGFKVRISGGLLLSTSEPQGRATHSWCEVFCPSLGYVPIDPAQGRYSYTRQSCFAKTDPNLIVWYIGDDSKGVQASEEPLADGSTLLPTKLNGSLWSSEALQAEASHKILDYQSNLVEQRSHLGLASSFKNITPTEPTASFSNVQDWPTIKQSIQTEPQNLDKAELWIRQYRLTENEIQDLNQMKEPAAQMMRAWQAIFQYNWQEADYLLGQLPEQHQAVIKAKAFLNIFTMQSPAAAKELKRLSSPLPNFMAEAICQFCSDQRLWEELDSTAAFLANRLPDSYLLKIQWMRGAFKCSHSDSLQQAINSLTAEAPQDGYPYLVLGQLYLEKNHIAESLAMFNKAYSLELQPEEKKFIEALKTKLESVNNTESINETESVNGTDKVGPN